MGRDGPGYSGLVPDYEVRTLDLDGVIELRVALLDPEREGTAGPSAGDTHPSALHVGAFRDDQLVGVASTYPEGVPGGDTPHAWRLRGVGVEFGHRGAGVGALLVREHASGFDGRIAWCLAPARSVGFLERLGFDRTGDPIADPDRGPHRLMCRDLSPRSSAPAIEGA
jgi:GNAT superfamily N-acetyltransferase